MADAKFYIYVLFRETGIPFYVGKGNGDRWIDHQHETRRYNTHKHAIIRKMKASGHDIPKVKLHEHLTEDTAFAYEKALIAAIGRADQKRGPLANQTDGGEGASGWSATPEQRAAMSASRRGRSLPPTSPEHRAKLAEAARNRSPEARANLNAALRNKSPEWCANISASNKGRKRTPEFCAKAADRRRGQKHSIETRAKMSKSNRAASTPEKRAKVSAALTGRTFSEETRKKMAEAANRRWKDPMERAKMVEIARARESRIRSNKERLSS